MAKIVKRTIQFAAATAPDVQGYKLYWAVGDNVNYNSDNVDIGNTTSVTIPDDVPSFPLVEAEINLGVTAYDDMGNESDMTKVSAPFDFDAPDAPTNLEVI